MAENEINLPGFGRGLSARLLILTIAFIMLSEVLIYVPSIARFRRDWLEEKLNVGHLAILALETTPDYMIDPQLELKLLEHAGAHLVALHTADGKNLMLRGVVAPLVIDANTDLADRGFIYLATEAFKTLLQRANRVLRVEGRAARAPDTVVDIVLDEWPLRQAMIAYSWRVLGFSIALSLTTAALIFAALQWLMILPMRRLTQSMVRFRADPEVRDADRAIITRRDEIGLAARELDAMQSKVLQALRQRARLAALGTAVGKINHDLRGVLTTARLIADRLAESGGPEAQKAAPALVRSLDRAVDLCADILNFTREAPPPVLARIALAELHAEIGEGLASHLSDGRLWRNECPDGFVLTADREKLYRVIHNLAVNAYQMGARSVRLEAVHDKERILLRVADDGPGLPPKALENLFVPFKGSARAGGTGLGLAIGRELMRAQGGDLSLAQSDARGSVFLLELPTRDGSGALPQNS